MCYALRISDPPSIEKYADKEAMRQLSCPPPKWSLDADEELAKFMADHVNKQEASLGNISRYVESVQVSSVSCLFVMLKTCQVFLPVLSKQFINRMHESRGQTSDFQFLILTSNF